MDHAWSLRTELKKGMAQQQVDGNTPKSGKTGLLKTKSDKFMAIGMVVVLVAILAVWLSGLRSEKPDDSDKAISLTSEQRKSADATVKNFLNTAGNFGFDWENVSEKGKEPGKLDLKDVSRAWLKQAADPNGSPLEDDYAAHIVTRETALSALLQPYDGKVAPLSPSNSMNKQTFNYVTLSDAIYLSQFTTDENSVKVDWRGSQIKKNSDSLMAATVKVSWDTKWRRVTEIPLDNDNGTQAIPLSDWNVDVTDHPFQDVRMTLTSTDGGKNWQVSSVSDGGNNDWSKYNWMLAVGNDFKYDQTGKLLNIVSNDNNDEDD